MVALMTHPHSNELRGKKSGLGLGAQFGLVCTSDLLEQLLHHCSVDSRTSLHVSPFLQVCTWGAAFEVVGAQMEECLKYLNVREAVCGGYVTKVVDFFPRGQEEAPVPALVYIATADNPIYLGPATPEQIAAQIIVCKGKSGHNIEYLLRLAEFMRTSCPDVEDTHLFSIEAAALALLPMLLQ